MLKTHPAIKSITFTPAAPDGWCIKSSQALANSKRSFRPCYYTAEGECRWTTDRGMARIFATQAAADVVLRTVVKISTNKIAERARSAPFVPVRG